MSREFAQYITPEQAMELHNELNPKNKLPLSYWVKRSKITAKCSVCRVEPVWRWGQGDMCFTCTTGESDMSDDYELERG